MDISVSAENKVKINSFKFDCTPAELIAELNKDDKDRSPIIARKIDVLLKVDNLSEMEVRLGLNQFAKS